MADEASSSAQSAPEPGFAPPDFDRLNRYGWSWRGEGAVDENYMDLAYLVARNSSCKDGHMGCVLVSGIAPGQGAELSPAAPVGEVEICTINSALFGPHRSDCHAEANAVAAAARRGLPLAGLSCFVTRSPCLACYKLLASAGIGRIIAPQPLDSPDSAASASVLGIECRAVRDTEARDLWREALGRTNEDMDRIRALREERKRLRKEHKFGRKTIRSDGQESATAEEQASDPSMVE